MLGDYFINHNQYKYVVYEKYATNLGEDCPVKAADCSFIFDDLLNKEQQNYSIH